MVTMNWSYDCVEIRNDESSAKMIEAFQLLFLLVPPPNRMLLQQLLELLNLTSKNPYNKMTAHNLAVVFSPNIMGFKEVLYIYLALNDTAQDGIDCWINSPFQWNGKCVEKRYCSTVW